MLKTLIVISAVSGMALSTALAQKAQDRPPDVSPPAATSQPADQERPTAGPSGTTVAPKDDMAQTAQDKVDSAAGGVVTEQQPDQLLSSRLAGTDVVGSDGAKLGEVKDVLLNRDGQVAAVVIGIGGFLGIGAKDVALTFESFEVMPETAGETRTLKLAMTEEQLEQAVEFKRYEPPRPVASMPAQPGLTPARPQVPTN